MFVGKSRNPVGLIGMGIGIGVGTRIGVSAPDVVRMATPPRVPTQEVRVRT
jgi:hypothetical protein